jgi:sugar O-acyltransferase (sialic acid O-acetyltransferase NeuD family)
LVIGASGYAQEVAWSLSEQLRARGESAEMCFFDDAVAPGPVASKLGEVVGAIEEVAQHVGGDDALVLGIGLPRTKVKVVERLAPLALPWITVVHPLAAIGPNVEIGAGSYVGAGAIITVNARIGRFVTVNLHCQIAHDDVVGDFVTLHPDAHLSGNVTIGNGAELGTGTIVIPGVEVGRGATLGAGCVAVRSLEGGKTYAGIPARELSAPGR